MDQEGLGFSLCTVPLPEYVPLISDGLEQKSGVFQNKSRLNGKLVQQTSRVGIVKEELESRLPLVEF